ncbi:kinase subunit of RNA polymerase II carboxy-terminal domain kinase I [Orbilia oligospora]|uniref:cyclin-dependent kinase n=1 Tax=Orbilia oligospora TaxID=2813651 RepID=A0A7C8R9L1_ORBOL|nr:kinase subunit of RNA polymerase II carboxy-terminal domain kinase I [Orbilia oligospora]
MTKNKGSHDSYRPGTAGKPPTSTEERPERTKPRNRSRSPSRERRRSPPRHPGSRKRKIAVDTYIPGESSRDDRDRGRDRRDRSRDRRRSASPRRRSASPRRPSRERPDTAHKTDPRGKSPKRIRSPSPSRAAKRSRREGRSRSPRRHSPDPRGPSHRHRSKRSRSRSRHRSPEDIIRRPRKDSPDRRGKRDLDDLRARDSDRRRRSRSRDNDFAPRGSRHRSPERFSKVHPRDRSRSPPPYKGKGEKRPRRRRSPRRRDHSPNSIGSASPARRRGSTQSSDDVMSSLAKRPSLSESSNRNPAPKAPANDHPPAESTSSRLEIASEIGYIPRARTRSLSPYSKRRHLAEKSLPRDPRVREGPKQGRPPFPKGSRDKEIDRRGPPPSGPGPVTNARGRRRKQRRAADSYTTEEPRFRRSASPRPMMTGPNAIPTGPRAQEEFESASSAGSPERELGSQQHTPDPYKGMGNDILNSHEDAGTMDQRPPSPKERPEEYPPPPPSPPPPPPPIDTRAERDAALMPPPNAPRGPRSELSILEPPKPAPIDASKGKVRFSMGSAGGKGKMPTGPRSQEFGIPRRLGTSSNSVPVAQRKGAVASTTSRQEAPPAKAPAKPAPPVPRVIISRKTPFERIGLVGEGTYGQVFKAQNWMSKELVALKRVRMTSEKDGFPITAAREIKILQRLSKGTDNDKIIHLLDNMVESNGFYMIFEYMDHDLTGILNHPTFRLSYANIKDLAHQFFSGLAHIHRAGILHRDIKSSNILVNSEGQLKIADFGLARQYDKMYERLKIEQHFTNRIITLWYRPVEILLGETEYTTGPDVWSGGCVFMELFTRKAIFTGTNEITQLDYIWSILGTPSPSIWPDWKKMAWYSMLRPEQKYEPCFEKRFGSFVPADALALAQRIFTYDPKKRPKAEDILQDPYFTAGEPKMERTTALKHIEGEWHELESKKNRKKEREKQQTAAKAKALP